MATVVRPARSEPFPLVLPYTAQTETEGVAATCAVTVTEIPAQQGIVVDYDEITLNMGTSRQLTATLAAGVEDGAVTWTSGDTGWLRWMKLEGCPQSAQARLR